jgi:hypothetical protein
MRLRALDLMSVAELETNEAGDKEGWEGEEEDSDSD